MQYMPFAFDSTSFPQGAQLSSDAINQDIAFPVLPLTMRVKRVDPSLDRLRSVGFLDHLGDFIQVLFQIQSVCRRQPAERLKRHPFPVLDPTYLPLGTSAIDCW